MELRQRVIQVEGESADTMGLRLVVRERDELKQAVSGFETELVEIQAEAKALAEDRDNFKLLYEQVLNVLLQCTCMSVCVFNTVVFFY